jgi:hypothetical protein
MELLGSTDIPGTPEELDQLVRWTKNLAEDRGENYVKENRRRLLNQWDYILDLGFPNLPKEN